MKRWRHPENDLRCAMMTFYHLTTAYNSLLQLVIGISRFGKHSLIYFAWGVLGDSDAVTLELRSVVFLDEDPNLLPDELTIGSGRCLARINNGPVSSGTAAPVSSGSTSLLPSRPQVLHCTVTDRLCKVEEFSRLQVLSFAWTFPSDEWMQVAVI